MTLHGPHDGRRPTQKHTGRTIPREGPGPGTPRIDNAVLTTAAPDTPPSMRDTARLKPEPDTAGPPLDRHTPMMAQYQRVTFFIL